MRLSGKRRDRNQKPKDGGDLLTPTRNIVNDEYNRANGDQVQMAETRLVDFTDVLDASSPTTRDESTEDLVDEDGLLDEDNIGQQIIQRTSGI
jgi:hypothetical protein